MHYRCGFKGGFSVKLEGKAKNGAKQELKDLGFGVSDIAVYQPNCTPSDPTPYGIEHIYVDDAFSQISDCKDITIVHLDTVIYVYHQDLAGRVGSCKDATGSRLSVGTRIRPAETGIDTAFTPLAPLLEMEVRRVLESGESLRKLSCISLCSTPAPVALRTTLASGRPFCC